MRPTGFFPTAAIPLDICTRRRCCRPLIEWSMLTLAARPRMRPCCRTSCSGADGDSLLVGRTGMVRPGRGTLGRGPGRAQGFSHVYIAGPPSPIRPSASGSCWRSIAHVAGAGPKPAAARRSWPARGRSGLGDQIQRLAHAGRRRSRASSPGASLNGSRHREWLARLPDTRDDRAVYRAFAGAPSGSVWARASTAR